MSLDLLENFWGECSAERMALIWSQNRTWLLTLRNRTLNTVAIPPLLIQAPSNSLIFFSRNPFVLSTHWVYSAFYIILYGIIASNCNPIPILPLLSPHFTPHYTLEAKSTSLEDQSIPYTSVQWMTQYHNSSPVSKGLPWPALLWRLKCAQCQHRERARESHTTWAARSVPHQL